MEVILTGARPTGQLHIGNFLGAINPIIQLSQRYSDVRLFTATLHSFTDQNPRTTIEFVSGLVKDYIAAGVDPRKVIIFDQMSIAREIALATLYLSKLVTVNKLTKIPTLKDKLKSDAEAGSANGLLLYYPLMMGADILLQKTTLVPVGIDQRSHIEFSRDLVARFNSEYGTDGVFVMPESLIQSELNIMALNGEGKMSKTKPARAIFLGDDDATIAKKVQGAKTGLAGEITEAFKSLYHIGQLLANDAQKVELEKLYIKHSQGQAAMGDFKMILIEILTNFISTFRHKRKSISDYEVEQILKEGAEKARFSANQTLSAMEVAMTGMSFSNHLLSPL